MGFADAMVPLIFFVISIIAIAITSITIKTYLDTSKPRDTNFNFSAVILALSIIGMLASGYFSFSAMKGDAAVNAASPAGIAAPANIGATELNLANKLERASANAASQAAKAAEGAKLANALGATLGQLKKTT